MILPGESEIVICSATADCGLRTADCGLRTADPRTADRARSWLRQCPALGPRATCSVASNLLSLAETGRHMSGGLKALPVPQNVRPRWEVLDSTHQFVAVPLIESSSLKVVGEVDGL